MRGEAAQPWRCDECGTRTMLPTAARTKTPIGWALIEYAEARDGGGVTVHQTDLCGACFRALVEVIKSASPARSGVVRKLTEEE